MNSTTFQLVKSLSKSEKRYLKLYASTFRENSKLIALFNILEKQNEYNEKYTLSELRKKDNHEQFSLAKNRLYHLILKSMRSYYADKRINNRINIMFQNVDFLIQKKMGWDIIKKELKKIEGLALKHEKFNYLLEIMDITSIFEDHTEAQKTYHSIQLLLEKIRNASEYRHIHDNIAILIEKKGVRGDDNEEELKEIKQWIQTHELENETLAITRFSKMHYYNSHFLYSRFIGDPAYAYRTCKSFVNYLEQEPEFVHENPKSYRMALNNYLISQLEVHKTQDFLSTINKLKSIPEKYPAANNQEFKFGLRMRVYGLLLNYYNVSFQHSVAAELIPEIETYILDMEEFQNSTNLIGSRGMEISIYVQIVLLFFVLSRFSDSLIWLNRVLNKHKKYLDTAQDLNSFARIMNLLIHYEKGNYDLLEHQFRSTKRFLIKTEKYSSTEKEIVSFFQHNVSTDIPVEDFKKRLLVLKEKLQTLSKDSFQQLFFSYFDFMSWIDSKIENRPLVAVLREKAAMARKKK